MERAILFSCQATFHTTVGVSYPPTHHVACVMAGDSQAALRVTGGVGVRRRSPQADIIYLNFGLMLGQQSRCWAIIKTCVFHWSVVQSQKAVTVYFSSKQSQYFAFEEQWYLPARLGGEVFSIHRPDLPPRLVPGTWGAASARGQASEFWEGSREASSV